ncbi:MAG TPA: PEP/pyruvate-binding domain-containing protein, partial [Acidimicrobiia bacterium]|nr:PEP/pyruvate-binding domain-containing protein [Acidimicrobiia bacterium]
MLTTRGIVPLERAGTAGVALVGAKAANLGRALASGLPVFPGFTLTTAAVAALASRPGLEPVADAWAELSGNGDIPLVVRSSSPVEDQAGSSMAGRFTSVVDVRGWTAFCEAVAAVVHSAGDDGTGTGPMAVLVQPHLEPRLSGVLFGLDPLSGRRDRRVVVAVAGGPQRLVSGEVDGTRYLLGPRGRLVDRTGEPLPLTGWDRRALADLAREAALLFGSPQDIEWALDENGCLWLLQSRPVTAAAAVPAAVRGPVLGAGPVAETFPDPLGPLEEDLWVPPLRLALTESLHLTGAASRRRLASSSVVVTVGGRVAADLALLGALPGPRSPWSRLDPRPPFRRLRAAWTVGRLRAALPGLAASVTASVDADLTAVPALGGLPDDALLLLLRRGGDALVAVHGYEMLAGLLPAPTQSAASVALDALAVGRAEGLADPDVVATRPIVLALLPPSITVASRLPAGRPALGWDMRSSQGSFDDLAPREALRLRARWLHELHVRVALELGRRLADLGLLEGPGDVGLLSLAELESAVRDGTAPPSGDRRRLRLSPPLPAAFRLAPDGTVVAVVPAGKRRRSRPRPQGQGQGHGVSPGRGAGPVHAGPLPAAAGSVLVVATLDPGLAADLPGLAGLVAETGSVLSHLAILAREFGIPCVVGLPGAVGRFPPGTS